MSPQRSRVYRGYKSQDIVAKHLAATIWPYAQSTGAGRGGADCTGTPGCRIEIKARRGLLLGEWMRQAHGHAAGSGDLPLLVLRLDGFGPATVGSWPVVMTLDNAINLLRAAGYGEPLDAA